MEYAFGDGNNDNDEAAAITTVVEEADESLTRDFSDEIWFLVLKLSVHWDDPNAAGTA